MRWKKVSKTNSARRRLERGALARLGGLQLPFSWPSRKAKAAPEPEDRIRQLEQELEVTRKESHESKAELQSAKEEIQQLCMKLARALYDNSKML